MGEIVVTVLALLFSLWIAVVLSRGTYLPGILLWKHLVLGILLAWFFAQGIVAWVGLKWFSGAFEKGMTSDVIVMSHNIYEVIGLIIVLWVATVLHHRNDRRNHDPLAGVKKVAEDKKRWMEANGE